MKSIFVSLLAIVLTVNLAFAESTRKGGWDAFVGDFATSYKEMELPWLHLGYADNLNALQSVDSLLSQKRIFETTLQDLEHFEIPDLSEKQRLEHALIGYECRLNLERIDLALRWSELQVEEISSEGLRAVPMGEDWYAYFLKRWIDEQVTPEMVFALGESEIARVKSEMEKIQISSGLGVSEFKSKIQDEGFFYHSAEEVRDAFENAQNRLLEVLPNYFPHIDRVGPAGIERGTNKELAQVPAFYRNNSLMFNYFDKPFNRRQVYWIYLHEAVPGHHYQSTLAKGMKLSKIQGFFGQPAYSEGWAAYIEDLAIEINLYDDKYSAFGKWEWDLIRSVRLVLDVGLNYYKWSDEKALLYWKTHIEGLDDIGLREIARMNRWPAQVVTYKYGAKQFLRWKEEATQENGQTLFQYHSRLMEIGPLPLSVLDQVLAVGSNSNELKNDAPVSAVLTGEVDVVRDLQYFEGPEAHSEKHKLDLYLPMEDLSAPIILWIHAGAWSMGGRESESKLAMRFAERGVGVAAMSYRLSRPHLPGANSKTSEVKHPEHIKDVARAFSWLKNNLAKFGDEDRNVFVGGHSSKPSFPTLLGELRSAYWPCLYFFQTWLWAVISTSHGCAGSGS